MGCLAIGYEGLCIAGQERIEEKTWEGPELTKYLAYSK